MKRVWFGVLILLATPAMVRAQGKPDRWQVSIKAALARADTLAGHRGYSAIPLRLNGSLFIDEGENRTLPLVGGGNYLVVAVCDEDCRSLNLVLSNPNGDQVASYREDGNAPFLEVPGARNGDYTLRVIMRGCRKAPCRYGVAVYRKR